MNKKKKAGHTGTGNNNSNKDSNLLIEVRLIGGLLPYYKITFQNRIIEDCYPKAFAEIKKAIINLSTEIIKKTHIDEPKKISIKWE